MCSNYRSCAFSSFSVYSVDWHQNLCLRPAFTVLLWRRSDNNVTYGLRMLYDTVLPSYVRSENTSQVSLLSHQPRFAMLPPLHHLHHHVRSASCVRRTRRRRLANIRYIMYFLLPATILRCYCHIKTYAVVIFECNNAFLALHLNNL